MKAVWTVNVAVPYPGSFWTPGKRLAVLWKFGLDSLMVSGLGELVRACSCTPSFTPWAEQFDSMNVALC